MFDRRFPPFPIENHRRFCGYEAYPGSLVWGAGVLQMYKYNMSEGGDADDHYFHRIINTACVLRAAASLPLNSDIRLKFCCSICNFLTSRKRREEGALSLPLSLPPSLLPRSIDRPTLRQLFSASFLFSLVCRLLSIAIYSLPPLLTSPFLFPSSSMNANSSIDTLSISHFVPPIPACFPFSLPPRGREMFRAMAGKLPRRS